MNFVFLNYDEPVDSASLLTGIIIKHYYTHWRVYLDATQEYTRWLNAVNNNTIGELIHVEAINEELAYYQVYTTAPHRFYLMYFYYFN